MTKPTDEQLAWWRAAIKPGANLPREEGNPQAGYYRLRMARGAVWTPCAIFVDDDGNIRGAGYGGLYQMPLNIEIDLDKNWPYMMPISRADYDALVAMRNRNKHINNTDAASIVDFDHTPPSKEDGHDGHDE